MAPSTADPTLRIMALADAPVQSPFPELDVELSGVSLKETAYEVLVAVSGITAMSARTRPHRSRSGISSTASKLLKKAIIRPKSDKVKDQTISRAAKKPQTTAEIVRYQMEISEQSDERIRRALMKAAMTQVNKPIEMMLIPLELLLNIGPSQFADQSEYKQWRLRQLRVLEAGLVMHPAYDPEGEDELSDRLQQMLVDLAGNSVETGSKSEAWLSLRIAAMAKAGRTQNGESPRSAIHWADGFPLNVHLYECMLSHCFDTLDEAVLVDEFDEILDWIKKTWGILGINPMLHSLCFMWVLFSQYVKTGEVEAQLLVAAEEQMREAAAEAKTTTTLNADYLNCFKSAVVTIHQWAEPRLMDYREAFPQGAEGGAMGALLSLNLAAARINGEDIQKISARKRKGLATLEIDKVDSYIRSTMLAAFTKVKSNLPSKKGLGRDGEKPRPELTVLAEEVGMLARNERTKFSPVMKPWHATPAGVAAAALHSCFAKELSQFTTNTKGITPDVLVALQSADQLETDLVQIAVEDGVDAEDGGKSLIHEISLYDAQSTIESLSKKWVYDCVGRVTEWADRNVQNEQWNSKATREGYAPSAVEVLRVIEEILDAFFLLPISKEQEYVNRVVAGVVDGIHRYCEKTVAGRGNKDDFVPSLPGLTRFNRKAYPQKGTWRSMLQTKKTRRSASFSSPSKRGSDLENLCVRINTLNHLSAELQFLEKRLTYGWTTKDGAEGGPAAGVENAVVKESFRKLREELEKGVQRLIELASYKVVFYDLRGVFWEGLYLEGVQNSRIAPVIEQIDPQLGVIAEVASEQLRNRIVAALMKACLDCFVLVLLAGGPSRMYTIADADMLEDDFTSLKDLFKADGEGLPEDLVESAAAPTAKILTLFHMSTERLIQALKQSYPEPDSAGVSRFSKLAPVPRTTGKWSPSDPNTILRVLCYRADEPATKYLKKTFNLPKKVS